MSPSTDEKIQILPVEKGTFPLLSISIYRLQEWIGEASGRAEDWGVHPEEERAGKRSLGTEEEDGLAGRGKEGEFERGGPVPVIAVRRAAHNPRCHCVDTR